MLARASARSRSVPSRLALVLAPVLVTATLAWAVSGCGSDVVPAETSSTGAGGGGGGSADATTSASSTAAGGDVVGGLCDGEGTLRCSDDAPGDILACEGGKYTKLGACGAGVACHDVQGADSVACDDTFLGVEGSPCVGESTAVCDFAREVVLGCDAGVWKTFTHCAPTACTNVPLEAGLLCSGTACATCGYMLGDRCNFLPGTVNCSTSGSQIVACEDGAVVLFEDCGASGLSCTRNGGVIECL